MLNLEFSAEYWGHVDRVSAKRCVTVRFSSKGSFLGKQRLFRVRDRFSARGSAHDAILCSFLVFAGVQGADKMLEVYRVRSDEEVQKKVTHSRSTLNRQLGLGGLAMR